MKVEKNRLLGDGTSPNHRPFAPTSFWNVPNTASTTALAPSRNKTPRTRRRLGSTRKRLKQERTMTLNCHSSFHASQGSAAVGSQGLGSAITSERSPATITSLKPGLKQLA